MFLIPNNTRSVSPNLSYNHSTAIFRKEINFEMCKYVVEVEDGGRVAMWGDTGYNKPLHCIKSLI